METYITGTIAPNITLDVDVDTFGAAASRAHKKPTDGSGMSTAVAHSVDATGDIANAHLGGAASLSDNTLTIVTFINLGGDDVEREEEFERLSVVYFLSGGDEGDKDFSSDFKLHNADFTRITVVKSISLIP